MALVDTQQYEACHQEAVTRCHAIDNWHENTNKLPGQDQKVVVDPGPQVLACLYHSGFDEADPLGKECALYVRQVLRERAARVNMLPDIEENCCDALSEYCFQIVMLDNYCSPKVDIESEGKTVHSFLVHSQEKDEGKNGLHYFKTQERERKKAEEDKSVKQRQWHNLLAFTEKGAIVCLLELHMHSDRMEFALLEVVKLADIGSNYKLDNGCKTDGALEANTLSSCLMMHNMDKSEMTGEYEQRRPAAWRNSTGTRSARTSESTKIIIVLLFVVHLVFCVAADELKKGTAGNSGWLDVLLYVLWGLGGVAVVSIASCAIVALFVAIRRCCRKDKTKDEEAPAEAAAGLSFIEELKRAISFRRETLHSKGMYV